MIDEERKVKAVKEFYWKECEGKWLKTDWQSKKRGMVGNNFYLLF